MALERGTTYVDLRARLDQYRRDLGVMQAETAAAATKVERTFSQRFAAFGSRARSIGKSMTVGLTLPLVGLGAVATNEFAEVQKVSAQTDAALESTGGAANVTKEEILALSASLGELAAKDAEEVQAAENVLLTFTKVRNELGKGNDIFNQASLAAANLAARLGTDLQSEMLRVGKAVNDPIKGVTALTRAGVQFTDQQKEQITAMVEAGDLIGAQKLVLEELELQVGGSAKAAGEAASPFEKLKLSFNEFAESLGESLMPILQDVADALKGVGEWFGNLSPGVRKFIVILGGVALVAGPVVGAIGAISTALAFLAAHPIVLAIAAVVALAVAIVKNWDSIKAVTGAVWDWVYGKIKWVWDYIIKWNPAIIFARLVVENFGKIKAVAGAVWDWMVSKVNWVIDRVRTLIGWIGDAVNALKNIVGDATGTVSREQILELTGETGAIDSDYGSIVRGPALIRQGPILEAHIPLTGPGARKWKSSGDTTINYVNYLTIHADSTTDGRKLGRFIREEIDKANHEHARSSRYQSRVAT